MKFKDHLNKLEYFSFIVESGSVLKASSRAHVSQPQLSKVIRQLEELLDKKLLIRSSSGVVPTQAGVQLYKLSKKLISSTNEAELLIKSDNVKIRGTIKIGTYDSISRYFFPEFLKFLKASMPDLIVLLETDRSSLILKKLIKGELDIVVSVGKGPKAKNIITKTIYSDTFGLFKSPKMTSDFEKHLVVFPDSINKEDVDSIEGFFPYLSKCSNLETVKALAEEGLGYGLLPMKVAREGVLSNKLIHHKNKKFKREFSPHDITLNYSKAIVSGSKQIIIKELERFLDIWSAN